MESSEKTNALTSIYDNLFDPLKGMVFKSIRWLGKYHHNTFQACELVTWMVKNGFADTREKAAELGGLLQHGGLIQSVVIGTTFKDKKFLMFQLTQKGEEKVRKTSGRKGTDSLRTKGSKKKKKSHSRTPTSLNEMEETSTKKVREGSYSDSDYSENEDGQRSNVDLIQWSFNKGATNPQVTLLKSNTVAQWNNSKNWALIRGTTKIENNYTLLELEKVCGNSNSIRIGICCKDVDYLQAIKTTYLNPTILKGTWTISKICPPIRVGDRLGVLVDLERARFLIFKNYKFINELNFSNHFLTTYQGSKSIFPLVALCGDIHVKISTTPNLSSYTTLTFSESSPLKQVKETPTLTMNDLLDELRVVTFKSQFDAITLENLTLEELNKLNIPTTLKNKIWISRHEII